MVIRLGAQDHGTSRHETLVVLNSYARQVGYKEDQLPFKNLSPPTANDDIEEFMGFSYSLPPDAPAIVNPTARNAGQGALNPEDSDNDDNLPEPEVDAERDSYLREIFGDDYDIEVVVNADLEVDPTQQQEQQLELHLHELDAEEAVQAFDNNNKELIQSELAKLVPHDGSRETTLQAFKRLTNNTAWFPFRKPNSSTPATDTDREEASYFNEVKDQYDRDADTGPRTYRRFSQAWNDEVARRFQLWSTGDEDIIQLRPKSIVQLQQFFDIQKEYEALAAVAPTTEDPHRLALQQTFRETRQMLPVTAPRFPVAPPVYTQRYGGFVPFGNPHVFNAAITQNIVTGYRGGPAPFQVALPNVTRREQRKVFRSKKYCIVCGWRKKEHGDDEGTGGRDRKGNSKCSREFCGNCYALKEHHVDGNFGPDCC